MVVDTDVDESSGKSTGTALIDGSRHSAALTTTEDPMSAFDTVDTVLATVDFIVDPEPVNKWDHLMMLPIQINCMH